MRSARNRWIRPLGVCFATALALTACGGETTTDPEATDPEATDGDTSAEQAFAPADSCDGLTVGTIGWTEDVAVNALWGHLLGDLGYSYENTSLEVGALYSGVASGDLDLFMDAWLPATHVDYWEQFGEEIDDLTTWFEQAPLTWAVPTYVAENEGITSIGDLQGKGEMFDGEVVGIEAGAGLTRISKEAVIPEYGLGDEYTLVESSTPAMLAALEGAIDSEENIVVTLWEPHSAYAKWDLTNLEDPQNALGDPDEIHMVASQSFSEECPNAAAALQNFNITSEGLADLELKIEEAGEGNEIEGVEAWIAENQDLVNEWLAI